MANIFGDDLDNLLDGPDTEPNFILGNGGNDTLIGGNFQDPLSTTQGIGGDVMFGGDGNDLIEGLDGNDLLRGDAGDDTMLGGNGDDHLRGYEGVDFYDGGDGFDRVSFFYLNATQGIVASLLTQTVYNDGFGNVESMNSIEGLGLGTQFSDIFIGDNNDNLFLASNGDFVFLLGGDDDIQLNGVPTLLLGGSGNDTITTFIDFILVPDADGDGFADILDRTAGVKVNLQAGIMKDIGFGDTGFVFGIENVGGSMFSDTLRGNGGDNDLLGFDGDDDIRGRNGDDTINGGLGADTLRGNRGEDTFVYENVEDSTVNAAGRDIIRGFDSGNDTIDLSGLADEVVDGSPLSIAAAFTGTPGQVVVTDLPGNRSRVDVDIDGDMASDFQIRLAGSDLPVASDFIL